MTGLREACGVFGVFPHSDAAELTILGLHALQHRGQEGAGVASWNGKRFNLRHVSGLVSDNLTSRDTVSPLRGHGAIGHVRYATRGGTGLHNAQPMFAELSSGGFALAHNGQLSGHAALRESLIGDGAIFRSDADSEIILHLLARRKGGDIADRFAATIGDLDGGFALLGLSPDRLIGSRDPYGLRPLVLGRLNDAFILASETCALDLVGAHFVRAVAPGETVVIDKNGIESRFSGAKRRPRPCLFELIYFARPDSLVDGVSLYEIRKRFGAALAEESPVDADLAAPAPDSGVPAALGFAEKSGLPFELALIRNHYVGRTFIEPSQKIRTLGVRLKHNVNAGLVRGKRIVLIDDSIVRGSTGARIVRICYEAGAREVHVRIASPPIRHPDYYGIDLPNCDSLFAAGRDNEAMRAELGASSLAFLSLDGLYRGAGYGRRDPHAPQLADHCFSGDYPTAVDGADGDPTSCGADPSADIAPDRFSGLGDEGPGGPGRPSSSPARLKPVARAQP